MKFLMSVVMLLIFSTAWAGDLKPAQMQTLSATFRAEPTLSAAVSQRRDDLIADWCNAASATDAWMKTASATAIFSAADITKYDALTAGKRASQDRLERYAPIDFGINKMRTAIVDIWGAADAVAILTALREKATNCQVALGGQSKTTQGVTGLDRTWAGALSVNDVSDILNRY